MKRGLIGLLLSVIVLICGVLADNVWGIIAGLFFIGWSLFDIVNYKNKRSD